MLIARSGLAGAERGHEPLFTPLHLQDDPEQALLALRRLVRERGYFEIAAVGEALPLPI